MMTNHVTSDQVLPLAAGIVFLAVVVAALRLSVGSGVPVTTNLPKEDARLALYNAIMPSTKLNLYLRPKGWDDYLL